VTPIAGVCGSNLLPVSALSIDYEIYFAATYRSAKDTVSLSEFGSGNIRYI